MMPGFGFGLLKTLQDSAQNQVKTRLLLPKTVWNCPKPPKTVWNCQLITNVSHW